MTQVRWGWLSATAVWMVGIWYLSDQPDLSTGLSSDFFWRKLAHIAEYAGLVFLLAHTLSGRWRERSVLLPAAGIALVYAILDEWHQSWVVGRHGTWRDVAIDALGICLVVIFAGRGRPKP